MSQSRLDALKKRAHDALTGIDYNPDEADVTGDDAPLRTYGGFDDEDEVKQESSPFLDKSAAVTIFQKALDKFHTKCNDEKHSNDITLDADVIFFESVKYFYVKQVKNLVGTSAEITQTKIHFNTYYCLPLAEYPKICIRSHYLSIYSHVHHPWLKMEKFYETNTEVAMVKDLKSFFTKAQCLLVLQCTRPLPFTDDRELALLIKNIAVAKKIAPDADFSQYEAILTNAKLSSQQKFVRLVSWLENECFKAETSYYQGFFQRRKRTGAYVAALNSKLDKSDYERMIHLILEDAYIVCEGKGADELTHVFLELNPRVSQSLQKGSRKEYSMIQTMSCALPQIKSSAI